MNEIPVSVIIPIYNGEPWINKCLTSILQQTALGRIAFEICVCDDSSNDQTPKLLRDWIRIFQNNNVTLKVFENDTGQPKGVGYAKNKAISMSCGVYLCFQDIDDVMLPNRILAQYMLGMQESKNTIIGSKFIREPKGSTIRFTSWANSLTEEQLNCQIYTSNGPTVVMPTWFCHKSVFQSIGGFDECGKGTPEDLIFFFQHMNLNGRVCRVDEILVIYYYHPDATTFSILEKTMWDIRMRELEKNVLIKWDCFTIWNAGKQGRKFYNSLNDNNKRKVIAFCDVDRNKIGSNYCYYDPNIRSITTNIPIVHFRDAKAPLIICVKQSMTNGEFERNLQSLNLKEQEHYVFFS